MMNLIKHIVIRQMLRAVNDQIYTVMQCFEIRIGEKHLKKKKNKYEGIRKNEKGFGKISILQ